MSWCVQCELLVRGDNAMCELCGSALPPDESLVDGRYRIVKKLGAGGMGDVYVADDLALQRQVALKFLGHHLSGIEEQRLFRREAVALAALKSEHIARVYAFGFDRGRAFFAMEFVHGTSLAAAIGDEHDARGLSAIRAVSVVRQIADGLAAVHAAGLVHCDIKPSNIVIEQGSGRAVLVDFGIATTAGSARDESGTFVGTPAYMAPEQILHDRPLTATCDVYALACTLFETLTGSTPYRADTIARLMAMHVGDPIPTLSDRNPALAPLDALMKRALAKEPTDRFANGRSFATALETAHTHFEKQPLKPAEESITSAFVRILIVDDEATLATLARRAAESAFGAAETYTDIAHSAEDALNRWASAPDLVILDLHLPGMDGAELLAQLRERRRGARMRAMVWSADPSEQAVRRCRALGVERVLRKPVVFRSLVDEIRQLATSAGWIAASPGIEALTVRRG
ncbi:MAG: protein kinase [Deltaproteobacteria bacterium]|nr:protein kinase [Deltaproteobacteria bacterium]